MKKLIVFLAITCGTIFNTYALTIKANLWKRSNCNPSEFCLPQAISTEQQIEIPEPEFQSFSQVALEFEDYWASLILTKRQESGGYYSFQVELLEKSTMNTLALCSRYESLETFETSIVGSCAGRGQNPSELIGITLSLPN